MKSEDYKRFANALGVLCEIHGRELSPIAVQVYFRALERFSIEVVEAVFTNAYVSCKWFPKPVELIELITGGPENVADRAEIQAAEVLRAVRHIGFYQSVKFDDPITNAVIQQGFGGWIQLCKDLHMDGEKWFFKDFNKSYAVYSRQKIKQNGHLAGQIELENSARGFEDQVPAPVQIGIKHIKKIDTESNEGIT